MLGGPKAHKKIMLGGHGFEVDEGLNGFEQGRCDSPISKVRGLENVAVRKHYARGSIVFAEGQPPRGIYVLCEGKAKVSISSPDGKTLILVIVQPGELLGLNATLTGQPHMATVQALERCRIDFISRENLLKLLDRDKKTYVEVAEALGRKLNAVVDHARLLLLSQSASEKLARLLVKWCDESGKRTAQGTRIEIGLTHEEIAQMICVSRETVTRVLGEFRRKHIVSLVDNAIFVRNRKALESVARC